MVKHSPLPMVTYVGNPGEQQRRKITNVLGQTNTTMFALNLRNGHVGSYICSDGTRVPAPAQQRTGNEESTWENDDNVLLWIGRTDSTLRAFDAKTDIEMWNISSSVVTPRPLGGMLNPEANINGGAMDQIIALPDHRVTYERNHTLLWTFPSSSGSSSSHSTNSSDSSDAQDSSSSDRLLNAPLTSAYIISRESDTAIPIRVRHYLKDNDKDTNDEEKMDNDNSKTSQQDNTDLVFIGSFHGINQRRENHENNKEDNSMHRMLYGLTQNEHGYNNSNRRSTEDWFHTETGVATQMQLNTHKTKLWPLRISNAPNTPSHSRFPTLPTPLSIIDNSNTDTSNSNLWFSSAFIIAILVSVIVFLTVVMVYVLFPTNTPKAFTKTDTNHKVNINTIPTDPNLALKQASTSTWIDYNNVLGTGSHGTVVYGGTYGERPVAVKRMLRHYYSIAKREISLLSKIDNHMNLVRYHAHEYIKGGDFIYLILEKCEGTLTWFMSQRRKWHIMNQTKKNTKANKTTKVKISQTSHTSQKEREYLKIALQELSSGMLHMHELHIVHRDIKPQNILLVPRHSSRRTPSKEKSVNNTNGNHNNNKSKNEINRNTREEDQDETEENIDEYLSWSKWRLKISDMGLGKSMASSSNSDGTLMNSNNGGNSSFALSSQMFMKQRKRTAEEGGDEYYCAVGTEGYMAPELLRKSNSTNGSKSTEGVALVNGSTQSVDSSKGDNAIKGTTRATRAVDIFSLGCVFYEAMSCDTNKIKKNKTKETEETKGTEDYPLGHLFGGRYERQRNILKGIVVGKLNDRVLGIGGSSLIRAMICSNPNQRKTAMDVMSHPYFWNATQWLRFIEEFSDRIGACDNVKNEGNALEHRLLASVEICNHEIFGFDSGIGGSGGGGGSGGTNTTVKSIEWVDKIGVMLQSDVAKFRKYNYDSVRDLIRYIRNKRHHLNELSDPRAKLLLGKSDTSFFHYFFHAARFLHLPMKCYLNASLYCQEERTFQKYFTLSKNKIDVDGATDNNIDNKTGVKKIVGIDTDRQWYLSKNDWSSLLIESSLNNLLHSKKYKKKLCKKWLVHETCESVQNGGVCSYAVDPIELRIQEEIVVDGKTKESKVSKVSKEKNRGNKSRTSGGRNRRNNKDGKGGNKSGRRNNANKKR